VERVGYRHDAQVSHDDGDDLRLVAERHRYRPSQQGEYHEGQRPERHHRQTAEPYRPAEPVTVARTVILPDKRRQRSSQ